MWIIVNLFIFLTASIQILFIPRFDLAQIRLKSLQWTLLIFLVNTIWLISGYCQQTLTTGITFQTQIQTLFILTPTSNFFGVDALTAPLLGLSLLLIPICILASWKSIKFLVKEFMLCLLLIDFLLLLTFTVLDLIWFYILFEGILIPMFIIIGVWGSREDKIAAAFYFFFFTLLGSLLFLLSIFIIYHKTGTTNTILLQSHMIEPWLQNYLFIGFMLSFAVKLPQFPWHIWLPQAHVEAPVAGSVLLAGILLKLGGYAYIRFCLPLFPQAVIFFSPLMSALGILAIFWGSINTVRQGDMKRLVAYSSVAHMGFVTLAIFSNTIEGILGATLVMIAHGFVSPALFIMVTLLYERHHTRLIRYFRGLTYTAPLFSLTFVSLSLMNMGLPPTGNFIAEFICLNSTFVNSPITAIFAGIGVVLSAAYALWFCNRICFGTFSPHLIINRDISRRELHILLPLIITPLIIGIIPGLLLTPLNSFSLVLFPLF